MNPRQYAGLALLLTVLAVVAVFYFWNDGDAKPEPVTVVGMGGGKGPFLEDPAVTKLLQEKYGLTIDFTRVPSIDTYAKCTGEIDFCWPSSQTIGELLEDKPGLNVLQSEVIFQSPIVIYSWAPIVDALIQQGIVQQTGDTYYIVDFARLLEMEKNGVTWASIGVPMLNGTVQIRTSDPTASNSGNSLVGLMANTLNGGGVADQAALGTIMPELVSWFNRQGMMPTTTTQLWEKFLTQGMGASPIISAYESNMIEYCLQNQSPSSQAMLNSVRTLYPSPTVWSSHPMIALTENGKRLIEALRDPEIQRLGWEHHGFRAAVPGVANNAGVCNLSGVPTSINSIVSMPNPDAMIAIIEGLGGQLVAAPTSTSGMATESIGGSGGNPIAADLRRNSVIASA